MSLYDKYFLFTMLIIIITRVVVYIFNKPSPTIKNFRTHHWMFGLQKYSFKYLYIYQQYFL